MRPGEIEGGPRRPLSLSERAYDTIEQMIVSRRLAPGTMVSESELAEELSLGRTPVREALARLKGIGFVEIHPRRGVRVTNVDVIRHLELLEVRRPLDETVAAARGDREVYFRAKRRLHESATRACYNQTLAATMASLYAQSRRFWYSYEPTDRFGERAQYHGGIIEGLVARDETRAVAGVAALFDFLDMLTRQALDRRILA